VLHIDRFRKIGRQRDEAVVGDVIHPLDDFRNAAARAGHLARLAEQRDRNLFLGARKPIGGREYLRFHREIRHLEAVVEKRICLRIEMHGQLVFDRIADFHQPVGQPIPRPLRSSSDITTSMLVLNWISRSRGSVTAPCRIPENSTP